jgi:hypothetical protein
MKVLRAMVVICRSKWQSRVFGRRSCRKENARPGKWVRGAKTGWHPGVPEVAEGRARVPSIFGAGGLEHTPRLLVVQRAARGSGSRRSRGGG